MKKESRLIVVNLFELPYGFILISIFVLFVSYSINAYYFLEVHDKSEDMSGICYFWEEVSP
jgi:hypothetical protein